MRVISSFRWPSRLAALLGLLAGHGDSAEDPVPVADRDPARAVDRVPARHPATRATPSTRGDDRTDTERWLRLGRDDRSSGGRVFERRLRWESLPIANGA